ncbi:MAG: hypothetical protein M1480_00705 [Bacteroidetes bacterium]|nr:hypothetical protein [Bacteroidota bacterium]
MKKTYLFWALAVIITVGGAYYQRVTGPTYPFSGNVLINNKNIFYKLERSHSSSDDYLIKLKTNHTDLKGFLMWRRFKSNDDWSIIPMAYFADTLFAELPKQPPAGKLQYQIILKNQNQVISIPAKQPLVIRFKGDVPLYILIPHVFAMFFAMLLSTRTGLEFFNKEPNLKKYAFWTLGILFIGGMILGPLVQLYAFGALWTGVPFGFDLTDNKTLIAFIGWIAAAAAIYKSKKPKIWVLGAAILLLVVYLIPHSVLGSELDYNKMDKQKNKIENVTTFNSQNKISGKRYE